MKLASDLFQEVIEIEEGTPCFLIVEKQDVLYKLIKGIYSEIEGNDEGIVFSDEAGIVKASKRVELITTFVPFELNEKRLINKIIPLLESISLDEEHFNFTMELMSNIEKYIIDLSEPLSFDISLENINASSLLKMSGVRISDDSLSDIERVWNYVSIVNELLGEKLFVFVNMSSFFCKDEIKLFVDSLAGHKFYSLFLENKEYPHIEGTKRLIIDEDLCII